MASAASGNLCGHKYTKQRFDEVLHELEQERQRVDEDLSERALDSPGKASLFLVGAVGLEPTLYGF